jgi:hypothetical protein
MTRVIVILAFLLSFGAGFYTGTHKVHKEATSEDSKTTTRPFRRPEGGLLQSDLNLTPDQQSEMKAIWADVSGPGQRSYSEKQHQARKEHDEAILKVLSSTTLEQIEKIDKDFVERIEGIDREWRKSYEEAVEKTRKMLNPDQLARYNQILSARTGLEGRGGRGGGREGGREGGWRDGSGPTSRPTSRPTTRPGGFGGGPSFGGGPGFGGGQISRPGPFLSFPSTRPAN